MDGGAHLERSIKHKYLVDQECVRLHQRTKRATGVLQSEISVGSDWRNRVTVSCGRRYLRSIKHVIFLHATQEGKISGIVSSNIPDLELPVLTYPLFSLIG